MFAKIKSIKAHEVLDSRGFPTICCVVETDAGTIGKSMVPSGASTGEREALELRDGDKKRYMGKGVLKAIENVNTIIAPALINIEVDKQNKIDETMLNLDGTEFKTKLGANAILSVSLACCATAAKYHKKPLYQYIRENILRKQNLDNVIYKLPVPMANVINGGQHADNTIDFQEFMFMPVGARTFAHATQIGSECFHSLQKLLKSRGMNTNKGDEGGFAPLLKNAEQVLDLMIQAIKEAGYNPGINKDVAIAMDCASSELYDKEKKVYVFEKAINASILTVEQGTKTTDQMIAYYEELVKKYPIISIEDGLAEGDWDGWIKLVEKIGDRVQIVGDDLFCTNPKITNEGIMRKAANAVLVKVNQIGTLTETLQTINEAKAANWCAVISHRSGETEDTFIADLAVACDTGQIKTGSYSRSERIAKYNRLLEIENQLSVKSSYPGLNAFYNINKKEGI